nr:helix-turn-helix domain-containing protein [Micrococcus endophyticus]
MTLPPSHRRQDSRPRTARPRLSSVPPTKAATEHRQNTAIYRRRSQDGLMLGILAAFAEFERRRIKERQAEGIALAKARGKYVQAPKLSDTDVEQARVMIEMGIPKAEVARAFGVSRQTLYTSIARRGSTHQ